MALLPWLFLCLLQQASLVVAESCQAPQDAGELEAQVGQVRCELVEARDELQNLRGQLEARQTYVEMLLERLEEANARNARRTAKVQVAPNTMRGARYSFGDTGSAGHAKQLRSGLAGRYDQSFQALLNGDEPSALRGFRVVAKQADDPELSARARLWVAELLSRAGQHAEAKLELQRLGDGPLPAELVEPVRKRVLGMGSDRAARAP